MSDGYLPDFGLFLRDQAGPDAAFVFDSFPISELARVDNDLFSVTATMPHHETLFTVTIDFSRERLHELAAVMPPALGRGLLEHFSTRFKQPQVVNLPMSIDVRIEAGLGDVNENGEESYLPLVVRSIRASS